jgi:hypothetical protein
LPDTLGLSRREGPRGCSSRSCTAAPTRRFVSTATATLKGVHTFSTSYLADRDVAVYSYDEILSPFTRLAEWGKAHGGGSYTFGSSERVDE